MSITYLVVKTFKRQRPDFEIRALCIDVLFLCLVLLA